ncbi:DUF3810 domain-containing protein [Paracnuella aquatica]|uniref:DUF3810 domain-containing protein n=1 Tax=Paracnuella aquatica TaxID=2268757 RepID=UPI000DEFB139|nr:DUF3810 domain-containing protein [Paracnuella aquatica]
MFLRPFLLRKVTLLLVVALLLGLLAQSPALVERWYSLGFYPPFSKVLRTGLGWLPFSFGDLLYAAAVIFLIWKAARLVRRWRQGGPKRHLLQRLLGQMLKGALVVYLVFQTFWGLNYSRQGIAAQMDLKVLPYQLRDLDILAQQLQTRLEETAPLIDTAARTRLDDNSFLEAQGVQAYSEVAQRLPFLTYQAPSVKPSLYSAVGHFVGFTGYYNPFTGEAQIKTSIPHFLKPFVTAHEMAHQLGYAKESEANFVAFLAGHQSSDPHMRYAVYFEMFLYTLSDIRQRDTAQARQYRQAAPPRVQRDLQALAQYLERSRNPVEPYMSWFYDAYLRWNKQPQGKLAYNEVVSWLVAFGKKHGRTAI